MKNGRSPRVLRAGYRADETSVMGSSRARSRYVLRDDKGGRNNEGKDNDE